jgi:replicative DNA helicase
LVDFVPSAANLGYYADIVRETSLRRSAARACAESLECIHGPPSPVETLLDEMEARVLAVRDRRHLPVETTLLDRVRNIVERWEAGSRGRSAELATGFPDLDRIVGGLRDSEIIVLAARPSTGKTALALDMVRHVAGQGIPVGLFSLEMDGDSLTERMIAAESRLNPRHALAWTPPEIQRCSTAAGRLARLPIHIDDSPSLSVNAIRARARRWQRRHGVRLIVIDYLQLVTSDGRDRREAVDAISRGLKSLAKELRLPVVVLAQLNRDVERENNRRPRLSDLRESGQIEQDADVVGMLYKADPDLAPDEPVMPINLDICKHRNGPLGTVRLVFFREHTRFESVAKGGQVSN